MLHLDPGGEGVLYVKPNSGGAFKTKKIHIGYHSRSFSWLMKVVIYGSHRPGCWRHSVCSTTTENGAIYVTFAVFEKE